MARPVTFSFRLGAEPKQLRLLRDALRRYLAESGVQGMVADEVVLACSEAAANGIEHPLDPEEDVVLIQAAFDGACLRIVVTDHGSWAEPSPSDRGRGLLCMRAVMDAVDVTCGPRGTRVDLVRTIAH